MAEPRVLVRDEPKRRMGVRTWSDDRAYTAVGWAGVVLTLAALADDALALYPLGLGSPEWEMATIGAVMQGLPLLSIGLAAIWVSGARLGRRWQLVMVGWVLVLAAAVIVAALLIFVTDVPLAIRATQSVARIGIYKLVARTLFMGALFGASYVFMGVMALRQARRRLPGGTIA